MELTNEHLAVLRSVANGGDVYGRREAELLRECESDGLVVICDPAEDIPGEMRQPYFGAIATAKGRAVSG